MSEVVPKRVVCAPFVTLFLNIKPGDAYETEIAMIVEEILKQRLQGIKNGEGVYVTPAFPKLIYVLYEHNNLTVPLSSMSAILIKQQLNIG